MAGLVLAGSFVAIRSGSDGGFWSGGRYLLTWGLLGLLAIVAIADRGRPDRLARRDPPRRGLHGHGVRPRAGSADPDRPAHRRRPPLVASLRQDHRHRERAHPRGAGAVHPDAVPGLHPAGRRADVHQAGYIDADVPGHPDPRRAVYPGGNGRGRYQHDHHDRPRGRAAEVDLATLLETARLSVPRPGRITRDRARSGSLKGTAGSGTAGFFPGRRSLSAGADRGRFRVAVALVSAAWTPSAGRD